MAKVIIIGGGLSGLSAAHTVLQNGGSILLIDKNAFLGGNSTKATSGINGAGTKTQSGRTIADSSAIFYEDTAKAARHLIRPHLVKVLTHESGAAVDWLQDSFGLDLSLVSRLGGHSHERTHRGPEKFPGMTITYGLMEKLEEICKKEPARARLVTKAKVTKLIKEGDEIVGVEYEKAGKKYTEQGPVIIAAGGYGADFTDDSLIKKHRPDLIEKNLATTNGAHCTGDGVKMALSVGANGVDMEQVQVHPTGLVDPKNPDAKVKFLAAEALRGCGGLLLDGNGKRFCDELGHRDYVTGEMWKNKGPYRLVLNSKASKEIEWHVKHYTGRGLMKAFTGAELAKEIGITKEELSKTFQEYNKCAQAKKDPYGKKYYSNTPVEIDDHFNVAFVTPVVHYTMGGVEVDEHSRVIGGKGAIPGLWAAGEVMGGVHGANRLGGSSLLDCVVFGRVAGMDSTQYLLKKILASGGVAGAGSASAANGVSINLRPGRSGVSIDVKWDGSTGATTSTGATEERIVSSGSAAPPPEGVDNWDDPEEDAKAGDAKKAGGMKEYTAEEVAKHNTKEDCWVIVNGQVLDVTKFMPDHPGGPNAILLFAGKDATAEFNMLHKPDVVEKYAPDSIIGTLKGANLKEIRAKL